MYFDCADLNGTLNFANSSNDCQWESVFTPFTGFVPGGITFLGFIEWILSMYKIGSDKYVRIYAQVANQTNPDPVLIVDAAVLDNTACASISNLVIELDADGLQPGSECCGVGAGTEAEINAV